MNRFFAENLDGPRVTLSADEAHHAVGVLRLTEGAEVELFDGKGRTAQGRIAQAGRKEVVVRVERASEPRTRPRPAVHLAFAVPKGKRLDWLLEKATELAAASLQPVRFDRSVAGGELAGAKGERWLGHCVAAAKQCGLNFLPELRGRQDLDEFLSRTAAEPASIRLLGDTGTDAVSLRAVLEQRRQHDRGEASPDIVLLIGPEGGLTQAERASCIQAGFVPVRLGATTLRIETAAVCLLVATIALAR